MIARERIDIDMDRLADLCRRYHVRELALFGSVLRDDFRDDSDIDVLVEFEPDASVSLFDHFHFNEEIDLLLGRNVDLVSKAGLPDLIHDDVVRSSMRLFPVVDSGVEPVPHAFRREVLLLRLMLEHADDLRDMLEGETLESFRTNHLLQSATEMVLVRIGRLAEVMPGDVRRDHPHVAWDEWAEFGARLIARYYDVDLDVVWTRSTVDVPVLHRAVTAILDSAQHAPHT